MLCLSTPHADCILPVRATEAPTSTLPQHAPRRMHLDVAPVSANASALPQHVLRGLHHLHHMTRRYKLCFASARPTRIASRVDQQSSCTRRLCLSTSYADCIRLAFAKARAKRALPQHVLRGLHPRSTTISSFRRIFASARPTRIASAKTHKVRLAFMTDGAVSR